MRKECVSKALVVLGFGMLLSSMVCGERGMPVYGGSIRETKAETEPTVTQIAEEPTYVTDLTEAFDVILNGATKEFIAGYAVDESFLMWLDAQYGDAFIVRLAYQVLDDEMYPEFWYEQTGSSMHVLWLRYCRDSGFERYRLENVYWQETARQDETVLGFIGDFNFAEGWYTTEYMRRQPRGVEDCFSEALLQEMQASDVLIMNNEFVYMEANRSAALPGKAYTFCAEPEMAELLQLFGADAVTLANNHVYDYGETGLLDTMRYLKEVGIPYVGAGADLQEASKVLYYVANGRKIALVSASQIERTVQYTKEATETQAGVLKTLHPERFLRVIAEAAAGSDYVIVLPHWGTEGNLYPDTSQRTLAELFVDAGADAIIGSHPHRLQGISYIGDVPVAYSLGNFWFSDGTLYTTVAQVVIEADGALHMRFLPCEQRNLVTKLLTEEAQKDGFYNYLAAISMGVGMDAAGNVYDKASEVYPTDAVKYDSDTATTDILGVTDNEGNAIDIVGNRK